MAQSGCSVAQLRCSVAQLVVRWPAVWQARVQIPARHPKEGFSLLAKQAMKTRREALANRYERMYCMNVIMNI